jgi:hypoxanthine phosphoribosyltransferase
LLEPITVNGDNFIVYISEDQIKERIKELAKRLNEDYKDKLPIFIGVLNGSFIFLSDLIREITIDCEIDFLKLSSYGDRKISSGDVRLLKDLNCQIEGRHIVIVEDIVDSGLSINYMEKLINIHNPESLRVVTLLHKERNVKLNINLDYVGFKIPDKFVIGYGLDYAQKARNLKSIYIIQ